MAGQGFYYHRDCTKMNKNQRSTIFLIDKNETEVIKLSCKSVKSAYRLVVNHIKNEEKKSNPKINFSTVDRSPELEGDYDVVM